jgi:hypothetical protein
VHPCDVRAGKCLEQVITEKPVPWSPLPDPFTLAGNSNWTDYTVSADVHFVSESPAAIMGRIDSSDVFQDEKAHWPSGYILRVRPDGEWVLLSAAFKQPVATFASGTVALDRKQWHRLMLTFRGTTVVATLDGHTLASVESTAHTHGMIGLGSEWNHVQFDNLSVKE